MFVRTYTRVRGCVWMYVCKPLISFESFENRFNRLRVIVGDGHLQIRFYTYPFIAVA